MFYPVYIDIVLVGICLIIAIIRILVKKRLNKSSAILWVCIGVVIILGGLFPRVVEKLSHLFLITYPPAFVFTVAIIILLIIDLKSTVVISELSATGQEMAMEVSIIRHEFLEQQKELEQLHVLISKVNEVVGKRELYLKQLKTIQLQTNIKQKLEMYGDLVYRSFWKLLVTKLKVEERKAFVITGEMGESV